MGLLEKLRRTPRHFVVVMGSPWTINGAETQSAAPQEVLKEIYDIAKYFPITITVEGPESTFHLEMDEEMNLRQLNKLAEDEVISLDDQDDKEPAESPLADVVEQVDYDSSGDSGETIETDETLGAKPSGFKRFLTKRNSVMASILLGVSVAIFAVMPMIMNGKGADDALAISPGAGEPWQTEIVEATATNQNFDELFKNKLWEIEPGEVESTSWFQAGVVTTKDDQIQLLDLQDGKEIASHTVEEINNVGEELRWATEFYADETPAVGMRVADLFIAITADGDSQQWKVPKDKEIGVFGTTPVMTDASENKKAADATYEALIVGSSKPQELVVNPDLVTRAVDGEWIIQLDPQSPQVVLNPVDRDDENAQPHSVELTVRNNEAKFIRHLDSGHGYSMALWEIEDQLYLGVHELHGDNAGQATTIVPAPFDEENATGWALGSGMDVFVVGPYAISARTGELTAFSETTTFTGAYSEAAVAEPTKSTRTVTLNNKIYTESNRIIGYHRNGIVLVRLLDGSVAAYGEYGGKA